MPGPTMPLPPWSRLALLLLASAAASGCGAPPSAEEVIMDTAQAPSEPDFGNVPTTKHPGTDIKEVVPCGPPCQLRFVLGPIIPDGTTVIGGTLQVTSDGDGDTIALPIPPGALEVVAALRFPTYHISHSEVDVDYQDRNQRTGHIHELMVMGETLAMR